MKKFWLGITLSCCFGFSLFAADIILPPPRRNGGMPLMEALQNRRTIRKFSAKPLTNQQMSDLLFAAWGISSPDGKRTAPSARNRQEISVYVLLESGVYRYEAAENRLRQLSNENLLADGQGAPLILAYVADTAKQPDPVYYSVDCGFIGENVYLFCASEKLATVFRGSFDRGIADRMRLGENDKLIFIQPVGHPGE